MGSEASEKIRQVVKIARERAKRAEADYDNGAYSLQRMASRSIDLFGGTAVSQVADIASEARKICDSLYASYQSLVGMVDSQCRPLLDQGPDYHAVGEVAELIKWLNDESEIENNFTASINDYSLGGVASGRYIPTIENKMIQTFWETQYEMCPGRAEAEAEERRKRAEEAERCKAEAERANREAEEKYQAAMAVYEREHAQWKQKADQIKAERKAQVEQRLAAAKQAEEEKIRKKHETAVAKAEKELADARKEAERAEAELAGLGFFKFAEKKAAKRTIEAMTAAIAGAESAKQKAETIYQDAMRGMPKWCKSKEKELYGQVEREFPMPTEPIKPRLSRIKPVVAPSLTSVQRENMSLKNLILECMECGMLYTVSEIQQLDPALEALSTPKISALARVLCDEGYIVRTEDKRVVYFSLA